MTKGSLVLPIVFIIAIITTSTECFSQAEKENLMREALENWIVGSSLAEKNLKDIIIRYPDDNTIVALCYYYLADICYVKKSYIESEEHLLEVLQVILPGGILKYTNLLNNPIGMDAAQLKFNAYSSIASLNLELKNYRKALVYFDFAKSTLFSSSLFLNDPTLSSKSQECFIAKSRASAYEGLEKYDSAVYTLIPFCFGKYPENLESVDHIKRIIPKAFDNNYVREQVQDFHVKKKGRSIALYLFMNEFEIYLDDNVYWENQDLLKQFIEDSELIQFARNSSW